ncbi:MAG: bifunctional GTP diphosphokinase/guanosine-3',5'-bis pyrophosphate 3'-pyrophosphohydrolase [Gammaproteobacteria bacterium]|nr:bifunctional GTP diphosphokinase/guanosine-3',5'-bis pyrophosphate 3'-pyrophosphohydrolase [Gammaproteobacteria bacterium]
MDQSRMFLISDLCAMLDDYLEPEQVQEVYQAYLFGAEAHEGQRRLSGEPYIYHPLAVAKILAGMRLDHKTIAAAILHDVIEDTDTAREHLAAQFGEEITALVDGVSKLSHIEFETKAQAQAENFRKMMLAMVKDIRVILIKLADRLHNMRTLGVMRPEKKRRIARETLEIYVPIATRLGLNRLRLELEDLGFAAYYPRRSRVIEEALKKARGNRREIVQKIEAAIDGRLRQEGLAGEVSGREKHLYSIYRKMQQKHLGFADVTDVFAFRIVVDRVDTCYRVLGAIHNLYKPIPGKFKDYIAIPKANGYQSLHTALLTPYGFPIEVQIRTLDMDKVAESGIASHWLYKSGDVSGGISHERAREWLRGLLEMQQNAGDSQEFLENVKVDLFPDEVYVFTPRGEIMELPRGATAVDFAYAVHSDVGNSCVAAKINRRLAPLHTELRNGQSVEIITSPGAQPNPSWLNFVFTGKARATIRNFLKNLQHDESITLGRRLLEKALSELTLKCDDIQEERWQALLQELGFGDRDALLEQIGLGNRMAPLVARALLPKEAGEVPSTSASESGSRPLSIKGTEGTVVQYAKCCRPIPGDPILGFLTSGRGIVIHTQHCKNVTEFRKHPEKWIDVQWEEGVEGEFPVELRVDVTNQRGVLATVAAAIAETRANIDNISLDERDGRNTTINLTIAVTGRVHLARILRHLRTIDQVMKISRK